MNREIRFGFLLNCAERQALAQLAESEGGLSQGAMLRSLIRTKAAERGLWPPKGEHGQDTQEGRDD